MPYRQKLSSLSTMLKNREISSVELIDCFLERIQRYKALNCFISIDEDRARSNALSSDNLRSKGFFTPLSGIPLAHKDIFCTKNLRTTCGSRILENFVSPYNATIVDKLEEAGAILIGKTNMDEFAMGSSTETSYFGPVLNPWDRKRVAGGSSGGSASAVAARLVPIATGTDTGGSISCLLYTSPSPRDGLLSRMPSSA